MLPLFWLYLWRTRQARRDHGSFTLTALAIVLAAYTLVLMTYGLNFLNFFDQPVPVEEFVKRLGKDGLGIIGGHGGGGAIVLSVPRLRSFPRDLRHNARRPALDARDRALLLVVHATAARDRLPASRSSRSASS